MMTPTPATSQLLVVENDPGLALLITESLRDLDFCCQVAASAQETLEILATELPTLLVLDYTLPDMNGEELVEILSGRGQLPPFIMITGREDAGLAVSMMKLGARDYLVKDDAFLDYLPTVVQRVRQELATERRLSEAEAALRESEERLRSTIASLDDPVFVLDRNGLFLELYHPSPGGYFALPREMFLGRPYWDAWLPAEMVKLLTKAIEEVKMFQEVRSFDYQLPEAGRSQWYSAKVSMRLGRDGSFAGITVVSRNITERKLFEEKLLHLSTHDALTGLYNRAYFDAELDRLMNGRHFPVSIVVADLDGLKKVNDSRGHAVGDRMIRQAAQSLLDAFRAEDVVARIGGDEFAVLLPGADASAALSAVQRARSGIEALNQVGLGVAISLSFGTATALEGSQLLPALKEADNQMYREKFTRPDHQSTTKEIAA